MANMKLIPECIDAPLKEGATPVFKVIGNTIASAWEIVFGAIDAKNEKVKYRRQKDILEFKNEIDKKINKIPKDKLIEGKLHIIGPILDSSKFFVEEKTIRDMFSSLLAASCNSDLRNCVHPSFRQIIEQLSTFDAYVLSILKRDESLATCNIVIEYKNNTRSYYCKNIFVDKDNLTDMTVDHCNMISISLNNLSRLGLISISYDSVLANYDYNIFNHIPCFLAIENEVKACLDEPEYELLSKVSIEKGGVELTDLGEDFLDICIRNDA